MAGHVGIQERPDVADAAPASRILAQGADWSVAEYVCTAGPQDRAFEEQHTFATIAAVLAGTFDYRTGNSRDLLHPGALMLGNFGACFECGHAHGSGDRCIALHFARELFEEIAANTSGSHKARFPSGMLSSRATPTATFVAMTLMAARAGEATEEVVMLCAEQVLSSALGVTPPRHGPSAADARRVAAVLRLVDAEPCGDLDLAAMAARAAMSKYHFLRTFRRVTGTTPHQYILVRRMHRAALALRSTGMAISATAFDAGFGDLSTFNARFRAIFGVTPGEYRRRSR